MQDPTYRCIGCSTRTLVVLHPTGEDCPFDIANRHLAETLAQDAMMAKVDESIRDWNEWIDNEQSAEAAKSL